MTDDTMEFRTDKKKALEGLKTKEGMGIEKSEWDITWKQGKKRKTEKGRGGKKQGGSTLLANEMLCQTCFSNFDLNLIYI